MPEESLIVRGAREHNLRNIDVTIPRDRLDRHHRPVGIGEVVVASIHLTPEAQRCYVESPSRTRDSVPRPHGKAGRGIPSKGSPRRSPSSRRAPDTIRDRPSARSRRSTITSGFSMRAGGNSTLLPTRPRGRASERRTDRRLDSGLGWKGTKIEILALLVRGRKGEFRELFEAARCCVEASSALS